MAVLRVPSHLRTLAAAAAVSPWRTPGIMRWWAFSHEAVGAGLAVAVAPRPAGEPVTEPMGPRRPAASPTSIASAQARSERRAHRRDADDLRVLSLLVERAQPVRLDELAGAFERAGDTAHIAHRLEHRGFVAIEHRDAHRLLAVTPLGRAHWEHSRADARAG